MAEKEYIEREAAIELLSQPITMSMCLSIEECHHKIAQQRIDRYLIENFPAADVRPVVRGKWETVMLDHERMGCRPTAHYCSECHQITWFRTFYCPNCGADMREES